MEQQNNNVTVSRLDRDNIDVVIYHGGCCDGFTSASIVYQYYKNKFPEKELVFHGAKIGAKPPLNLTGKNVLICDYSYNYITLRNLIEITKSILILDHHNSAQLDLAQIPDTYKIFNMKKSGSLITWEFMYDDSPVPLLVQYVNDRDIWTKCMPKVDQFAMWFFTLEHTFDNYLIYLNDPTKLEQMIDSKGVHYDELTKINVKNISESSVVKLTSIKDTIYLIAYCNSSLLKSDAGNEILKVYPNCDFSAVYSINDYNDTTHFSLRSEDNRTDVSLVAKILGGGGHKSASGVNIGMVTNTLPGVTYGGPELYNLLNNIYFGKFSHNDITYDIVYLNSPLHKGHLGKYLLQTRYIDEFNNNIQQCQSIFDNKYPDFYTDEFDHSQRTQCYDRINLKHIPKNVHVACIWDYDTTENKTYFTLIIEEKIREQIKEFFDEYFKCDTFKPIILDGYHDYIST